MFEQLSSSTTPYWVRFPHDSKWRIVPGGAHCGSSSFDVSSTAPNASPVATVEWVEWWKSNRERLANDILLELVVEQAACDMAERMAKQAEDEMLTIEVGCKEDGIDSEE